MRKTTVGKLIIYTIKRKNRSSYFVTGRGKRVKRWLIYSEHHGWNVLRPCRSWDCMCGSTHWHSTLGPEKLQDWEELHISSKLDFLLDMGMSIEKSFFNVRSTR